RLLEHARAHRHDARRGQLRKDPEGLACVNALVLARLAMERGMQVDVVDPYLPLDVVRYPVAPTRGLESDSGPSLPAAAPP
ncbi:MAG: immunity 49 family protein, partial [Planctomycetes bacterium]|nr:immunity 49 family protein [Planctomycetota bacterium]